MRRVRPSLSRARIFTSGPVITPATPEAARADVAKVAAMKVDIIKIRVDDNLGTTPKMAPEVYRAVIDEAHKRGLRVAVHLFYLDDAKGVLDAGADLIAHSVRDVDVDSDVIDKMKARGICLCPTLMREVSTFVYESTPAFFSDPLFVKYADPQWISQRKEPALQAKTAKDPTGQRYKVGARGRQPEHEEARRRRRADRDGHRHRPGRPVHGLLRADGAGADGEGGPDAEAGARCRRRAMPRAARRWRRTSARSNRQVGPTSWS